MPENNILKFSYTFESVEGNNKKFEINIDPQALEVIREQENNLPEWTKLKSFKCPHCPLDEDKNEYCPLAISIRQVLLFFNDVPSYEKTKVTVNAKERQYVKNVDIQTGVSSLMGIIMPTSGCPILAKLKPLVKFHLPFSTIEETEFKVFSMYLLAQFLKMKNGKEPDWEMKNLNELYNDILILNQNVAEKISKIEAMDAGINAVVILNNFADSVTFGLDTQDLSHLEGFFKELI